MLWPWRCKHTTTKSTHTYICNDIYKYMYILPHLYKCSWIVFGLELLIIYKSVLMFYLLWCLASAFVTFHNCTYKHTSIHTYCTHPTTPVCTLLSQWAPPRPPPTFLLQAQLSCLGGQQMAKAVYSYLLLNIICFINFALQMHCYTWPYSNDVIFAPVKSE